MNLSNSLRACFFFILLSIQLTQISAHRYNRWKRARQCICNDCNKDDIEKLSEPLHWAETFYVCKKCECSDRNTLLG